MIISAENVKKAYGDTVVLSGVSFIVEKGDKAAFVGVNGTGKTTLFNILAKVTEADSGTVTVAKGATISYLAQDEMPESGLTVAEEMTKAFDWLIDVEAKMRDKEAEIAASSQQGKADERLLGEYQSLVDYFEENGGYTYKSLIRGVISGLRLDGELENRKISALSGGQKTRAALGKALLTKPDILLLDEPTSNLDINTVKWLEGYLKSYDKTVLFVSHDRYFMDSVANKVFELENGVVNCYKGRRKAYSEYVEKKGAGLSAPKNKMRLNLEAGKESGFDVLFIEDVKKSYGQNAVLGGVSFEVKKGERVALIGGNGIGKTTLMRIIMKELAQDSGFVRFGVNVHAGYYDQERQSLNGELTVIDQIRERYPKMKDGEIRNVLAAFLFRGDDVFKAVLALSGGERCRLCFALIMLSGANLLLLDEPTNNLDVVSKEILENALTDFDGTCLYVSHDRYFINKTATRILELTNDGITGYLGDYDYYLRKKAENEENAAEAQALQILKPVSAKNQEREAKKAGLALERKRQNELKKIERKIMETEAAIADCDALLAQESVYTSAEKSQEVFDTKTRLEDELLALYGELS